MADVAVAGRGLTPHRRVRTTAFRHDVRLIRRSTIGWVLLFAAFAASTVTAYTSAYTTAQARQAIALLIEGNRAFQALYGLARQIDTTGGFLAWRSGGALAIIAGIWGLLMSTRILRGEEELGRYELVVGGALTPVSAVGAALVAMGLAFVLVWVFLFAVLVKLGQGAGGSAVFALEVAGSGLLFAAVGSLSSQLVPVRRRAASLAGIVLGVSVLLRVLADGTSGLDILRGVTPLGWAESLHPYTGDDLVWAVPMVMTIVVLGVATLLIARHRDLHAGVLWSSEGGRSSDRMLGSSLGFAARLSVMPTAVWSICLAAFTAVLGLLANDVAEFVARSPSFQRLARRLGVSSFGTAEGFISFSFSFLLVAVCLFVGFRVQATREEEASGRLDNVLVRAVGRRSWLGSQALVAGAAAVVVSFAAGLAAWAAAASRGADVGLAGMLAAAANCVPVAVLFLGVGVLAFAVAPRAAPAVVFGAVAVAFMLQLVGSLAHVPRVVLDLSPFHHAAAVPAQPLNGMAAAVMGLLGIAAVLAGLEAFARRDVAGA